MICADDQTEFSEEEYRRYRDNKVLEIRKAVPSTFVFSGFKGRAHRKQKQGLIELLSVSKLDALHRHNTENSKYIFSEKELRGLSPNFHIHVSVSDLYLPRIGLPILLQENTWTDPDRYINGIFVAVRD